MKRIDNIHKKIIYTACQENAWYFNVANLHYKWVGGTFYLPEKRRWYRQLRKCCQGGYIKAYVDVYTPTKRNPDIFDISFVEVDSIDFRRRMHFRATRKGWAAYRKLEGTSKEEGITEFRV